MSRLSLPILVIAALLVCFVAIPVGAVIQEVTVKGAVSTVNQPKNTLTINFPAQYGCNYLPSGAPECTWTPLNMSSVTGTVPDAAAFSVFKSGDLTVATSLGGTGDTWITLAKLYGERSNEEFVTDIIGDPTTIPQPLISNYSINYATAPDCAACSGVTCTAKSSNVTVLSSGGVVAAKTLLPGDTLAFNGRNDGSSISVMFIRGQSLSSACPQAQAGLIGGTQPVSDYIVKVIPPLNYNQINIRTATTTRPDEALPTTSLTVLIPTSSPAPTKSGSLPFVTAGALCLIGTLFVMKKR